MRQPMGRQAAAFYPTVTAICTTLVFSMMRTPHRELPLDYRLLAAVWHLPGFMWQTHAPANCGYSLERSNAGADH